MNFVVFALPRSRTAWISRFLSYGGQTCLHDMSLDARSLDDLRYRLMCPMTGACDSALAIFWPELRTWLPASRFVTVRRDLGDVRTSALRHGYSAAEIDEPLRFLSHCLDEIERDHDVMRLEYRDLDTEDDCRRLFERCTGLHHDHDWWEALRHRNIQVSRAETMRRAAANADAMKAVFAPAWDRARAKFAEVAA